MQVSNSTGRWYGALNLEHRLLFLLICLGIAVRIYNIFTASAIDMDGIEFAGVADSLLRGSLQGALSNARLPAFPAVMAFFGLFVRDLELAGRLASLVFGLLLIILCFHFVKGLWGREKALWISSFIAIHPYLAEYSARVLAESTATFLFTACLFFYYKGWVSANSRKLMVAGLFLAFAYLTKPEYVLYFIPLSLILLLSSQKESALSKKSFLLLSFLAFSLLIVISFLIYLRLHTGYWVIDRRVIHWTPREKMGILTYFVQELSTPGVLSRFPTVLFNFCKAVYLPFLILAVLGFRKLSPSFRLLTVTVVVFHVVGRSFPTYSTSRYSVEFAPLVLVSAAFGANAIKEFFAEYRYWRFAAAALFLATAVVLLFQGIKPPNYGREMQKKAGIMLRNNGGVTNIAARLPITAFYAGAVWVDLERTLRTARTCGDLAGSIASAKVEYIAIDEKIEKVNPFIRDCASKYELVARLKRAGKGVEMYRVRQ